MAFAIKCVTKYVRYFRLSALKTVELTITYAKYGLQMNKQSHSYFLLFEQTDITTDVCFIS